jgi:hypothetical protein
MPQLARTGPWTGAEYEVLYNHPGTAAEIAAVLGRGVAEVRARMELTFEAWYARHGCPWAPERPDGLRRVALKIWEENGFQSWVDEGEFEMHLIEQMEMCFHNFRPEKARQEVDGPARFATYFATCWRRRMRQAVRDARRVEVLPPTPGTRPTWPKALLKDALRKLDPADRRFVRARYLEGRPRSEMDREFGMAPKTMSSRWPFPRVAALVREAIGRLPKQAVRAWADYLEDEVGLARTAIASVLCITPAEVDGLMGI